MRSLTHSVRRLDLRSPRVLLTLLFTLMGGFLLYFYSQESYDYTSQSIQAVSEKLEYVNARIDSWKKLQQWEVENHVESVTLGETQPTSTISTPAKNTATHFVEDSSMELVRPKENAVIIMFGRNAELHKVLQTMRTVEDRFNKRYSYDWLFISDMAHSKNFKRMTSVMSSGECKYYTASRKDVFTYPKNIDKARLKDARKMLRQKNVGTVKSQRVKHLQRFWTKDIFNLDVLQGYDYYMRVDIGSRFFCDIGLDPFRYMREHNKTYGFAFAHKSAVKGYPTLWAQTLKYIEENPQDIAAKHLMEFMSDDQGETFNGCQLRTRFEIGDLNFFRGEAYQKLSGYYDESCGLYYEAWEDSTIRTIGVTLLQDRSHLQFFSNLGFNDNDVVNQNNMNLKQCPYERSVRLKAQCSCDPVDDTLWVGDSCVEKFFEANGFQIPADVPNRLQHKAEVEEIKKQENEQRKYEEEQLRLEKERENEETKKMLEENAGKDTESVDLEEQEGEPIGPGDDTPNVEE